MKRNRNRQSGVAAIEFAFVIVPLLLLVFGITEYGRAIYQYNTLVKAVRDAARFRSASGSSVDSTAKNRVVCGQDDCTGMQPLVPGLTNSMVSITELQVDATSSGGFVSRINLVTVQVAGYQFISAVNFKIGGVQFGAPNMTFSPVSSTMRQAE